MHFGILKTTEKTQRLGTDSAVMRYANFTLALV